MDTTRSRVLLRLLTGLALLAGVALAGPVHSATPTAGYQPRSGVLFNHPYVAGRRGRIERTVVRMIKASPAGSTIRIAAYSIGSPRVVRSLIRADRRGVRVRLIGNSHLIDPTEDFYSPGFVKLQATLGTDRSRDSWAIVCHRSCRGTGGNEHMKLYLFERTGAANWVSATGSANLTTFATGNQWNHLRVVVGDQVAYDALTGVFEEMSLDRPAPMLPWTLLPTALMGGAMVFPAPRLGARDPVSTLLSQVRCQTTLPQGGTRPSVLRISMYTWADDRGLRLAEQVRDLWDAGCDVKVETAILGPRVAGRLLARSGRGPIPTKQVLATDANGAVVGYLHGKWLTVDGATAAAPLGVHAVIAGSANWSDLGLSSDEYTGSYDSAVDLAAFNRDFDLVWSQPQALPWGSARATSLRARTSAATSVFEGD